MKRTTDPSEGPLHKRPNTEVQHESIADVEITDAPTMSSSSAPVAHDSKDFFKPIGEHVNDDEQLTTTEPRASKRW